MTKKTESKKYSDMYHEVETLVKKIERQDVEIDELVPHVEKAIELISMMKQRLDETKLKIENISKESK